MIIGISSRKKGGKSTLARLLAQYATDLWPLWQGGARRVTPVLRLAMADPIKQIAIDLLELPAELVHGDDDAKNTLTRYQWQSMPHYAKLVARLGASAPPPDSLMTIREILQQLGTEIFREMFADVFVNRWRRMAAAWLRQNPGGVVLCDDVRFDNEIKGLREDGGFLLRLTHGVRGDGHASEQNLDGHPLFHGTIRNENLTPEDVLSMVIHQLHYQRLITEQDLQITHLRMGYRLSQNSILLWGDEVAV